MADAANQEVLLLTGAVFLSLENKRIKGNSIQNVKHSGVFAFMWKQVNLFYWEYLFLLFVHADPWWLCATWFDFSPALQQ